MKPQPLSLTQFCQQLPKAELHAHISGSARDLTILDLLQTRGPLAAQKFEAFLAQLQGHRTLEKAFAYFPFLHQALSDAAALRRVIHEVIEDFAHESALIIELRSTPRNLAPSSTTATPSSLISSSPPSLTFSSLNGNNPHLAYFETILDQIERSEANINQERAKRAKIPVTVAFLASIDREKHDGQAALAIVQAALTCRQQNPRYKTRLVGIDLGGNPDPAKSHKMEVYAEAFQLAKDHHLKLSLHTGEVTGAAAEHNDLLALQWADRVGHFVCSDHQLVVEKLLRQPIECCLTSNRMTCSMPSLSDHHPFRHWWAHRHPIALCTDDTALFQSTISQEYQKAAEAFGLSRQDLIELARMSIQNSFIADASKQKYLEELERFAILSLQ